MNRSCVSKKVYVKTFGCQMNEYDSDKMVDVLRAAQGYEQTVDIGAADLILFNTCSVREKAQEKVFSDLGRIKHLKAKGVMIGVGGCVASQEGAAIIARAPYVDVVFGPQTLHRLPELLAQRVLQDRPQVDISFPEVEKFDHLPPARVDGASAFVSIMEGCSKYCSYCVVPYTRGRERSLPLDDLLRQVRHAVEGGYREVVFLGQTVNSYHDGTHDFADLLRAANDVDGLLRIRYTSPHPSDMSERVIAAMVECEKVMPAAHLPLQSASDPILKAMDRCYTMDEYRAVAGRLRAAIPGLAMSTDIIVGFPGESEDDFARTCEFMREWRFDSAFLFKYSARPDTKAFKLPETVSEDEKGRRLAALIELQHAISGEINDRSLGAEVEVLVENLSRRGGEDGDPAARGAGQLYGKSREFKTVVFTDDGTPAGSLKRVRIVGTTPITLIGEPADTPRTDPSLVQIG